MVRFPNCVIENLLETNTKLTLNLFRNMVEHIINDVYLPGIRDSYPAVLEELDGIAKGAAVSIEEIIMLNARYDLARVRGKIQHSSDTQDDKNNGAHIGSEDAANECTSIYISPEASATGDAFTAQNWDNAAHLYLNDTVIYLESHPSEDLPSIFAVTEAGQLVRSGINSNGLGLTANSLVSTADFVPTSYTNTAGASVHVPTVPAVPISLLRRQFLESPTFATGLGSIQNGPRHVSMNVTVATSEGSGMCLEVMPDRIYRIHSKDGYVVHSNHFLHTGFLARSDARDTYPGGSSWYRKERCEKGIEPYKKCGVSVERLINSFKDHLGYPDSLCSHLHDALLDKIQDPNSGPTLTIACVAYNLNQRTIRVCKGPPCEGVFQDFRLRPSKSV